MAILRIFDKSRNPIGVLPSAYDVQRQRRINSDYTLTFNIPMSSEEYRELIALKGHVQDERGQLYVINSRRRNREGKTLNAQVSCSHVMFKLADYKMPYSSYISEAYGIHISRLTDAISAATNGRFTFSIDDTFDLYDVKDWGRTNALEALNAVISMYVAEVDPDNFVIHLRKKIGGDFGHQYRINKNIVSSSYGDDGSALVTRMYAQMKDGRTWIGQPATILTADERARLAAIPGAIVNGVLQSNYLVSQYASAWATSDIAYYDGEIIEQNITDVAELVRKTRKALADNEVPALELSVSAADIHKIDASESTVALGDVVYCYDPEMGLANITSRVTELAEYPFDRDKHTQATVANVMTRDFSDIIADLDRAKRIVNDIMSAGTIRTEVFESFAKQAVIDVDASKTEVKYDTRGIILQDKNNALNQVVMTANGIVLTTDGGATARAAVTANGIIAERIIGQLGSFVSLLIGSGNNVTQINTNGIAAGHAVFNSAPFRVDMQGNTTMNRLTANSANIFESNLNASTWKDGYFSGNITALGEITGGTLTGALIRTAASGRRVELSASGFRSYDANGTTRVQILTSDNSSAAAIVLRDASGTSVGELNSYANNGTLTMYGNSIVIGSNNTANPIRLQGAVTFGGSVSGLNLQIANVSGLQSELQALWIAVNGKAPSGHTHTVSVPNHNHGNPDNATSGGGTFTTSSA
ncbi:phage tail protein [Paenibacillus xylanilyticus]|uniref:phage tail protein n=1 Tax=Paenibacillus xylanilyticus TaxID=248903 RepID=UPI00129D33E1|nr:phage tail protein [Paenibacillus xylanilyticus]